MMSASYAGHETIDRLAYRAQPSGPSRSRFRSRHANRVNLSLRIFLATAISVVTLLVSLSICSALSRRTQLSRVTRRRLAEAGGGIDEDELSIIEGCLDLENEMGIMQQRAASSSNGDSSTRVNELISMLAHAAAAREAAQGRLHFDGQLHVDGQLVEGRIGFEPEGGDLVHLHAPSLEASTEDRASRSVSPVLDPDSWIEGIPSISGQPEEQQSPVLSLSTGDAPSTGQVPAMTAPMQEHAGGLGIDDHPYVRLPVLEEGVVPRHIKLSALFDKSQRMLATHGYLLTMRRLFKQRTLNQQDVDVLVHAVERLVNTYWRRSQSLPRLRSPIIFVEVLGDYFILFDYIICASQLLGEYMQLPIWWGKFAASFTTNKPLPAPGTTGKHLKAEFHRNLTRRLVAALDTYKTGRRPPLEEVHALKQMLFCSPFGRHRLKGSRWEPWRKDGQCP